MEDRGWLVFLGICCVLFAGPAWFLAKIQVLELGISPQLSVGFRMLLGGVFLKIIGRNSRFDVRNEVSFRSLGLIFLMGLSLYGVNFWLAYGATKYMSSGLIAVILAVTIIPNMILGKFFLHKTVSIKQIISAIFGILGVFLCFSSEFRDSSLDGQIMLGMILVFCSTFFTVFGSIIIGKLVDLKFNTYFLTYSGMIIGGSLSVVYSVIFTQNEWKNILSLMFVGSILYLSLLVTTSSSLVYTKMIEKIGPGPASFLWIVLPVNSLLFSSFFEDYHWDLITTIGMLFVMIGGGLMVKKKVTN